MKTLLSSAALLVTLLLAVPANAQTDTTNLPPNLQGPSVPEEFCPTRPPSISLVTPNPYQQGYLGVIGGGATLQSRTRLSGDRFDPDGNVSFSAGLGDPVKYVGFSFLVNIYGLAEDRGASNNFGEGTIDVHFSRRLSDGLWLGAGGYDLTGWKREIPNQLSTVYVVATKTVPLGTSRPLYLNVGLGNGRFRSTEKFDVEKGGSPNLFGSLAVPVLPEANFIVEWSGFNLFSGVSVFPFKDMPGQLVIGMDDIFHEKRSFILAGSISLHLLQRKKRACWRSFGWTPPPPPQPSRT